MKTLLHARLFVLTQFIFLATFSAIFLRPSDAKTTPLLAQSCTMPPAALASAETREITSQDFGFSFDIPANYRTTLNRNPSGITTIGVMNPSTYEEFQCLTGGVLDPYQTWPGLSVDVSPHSGGSLESVVRSTADSPGSIREISVAGQQAFVYVTDFADMYLYVSFLTPNKKNMVSISSVLRNRSSQSDLFEEDALELIVNSFSF